MANHEIMMDNRGQMESMANIVKSVENTTIHESNPKPKENIGTKIKRLFAAGAAAATIATGAGSLAGCDQIQKTTFTEVEPSETEPSVTVTPTETTVKVTPTEAPTPTPTEAPLTPEQQEEKDLQEKMNLAPDIEGAEKVIKEINGLKRVTYERNGEYIGEYKKEVTQTDENGKVTEIGGIVLSGSEAKKILDEQLAILPEGNKWLIPLPADVSDLTTLENVNLDLNADPFFSGEPIAIRISFGDETIDVSNVIPGETKIDQAIYPTMLNYSHNISSINASSGEIVVGDEMDFITVFAKFTDDPWKAYDKTLKMGDSFGKTSNPILVCMSAVFGELGDQSFDKILKKDGAAVFVDSE